MKSGSFLAFIFILSSFSSYSQEINFLNFSALTIPDSIKKDANVIYRLDEATLEVYSPSKYNFKVHQIVTILNEKGSDFLRHSLRFDKFNKVEDVEIKLYNSLGLEVRKYKKKDFEIESAYDPISLVTDDRVMLLTTPAPGYPCSIEIEYERNALGYINFPGWYINTNSTATEIFRYIVKIPSDFEIRYRALNINLQPTVKNIGKQIIYSWEAKNIKPAKVQTNGYVAGSYMPQIQVAPNVFEYNGFSGEFRDWKGFGKWNYALYEEKKPFSEQREVEIRSMTSSLTDTRDKVKVLYEYLKKNTRYVSIQLGIGGFKPFAVKFVDENKYGDCKALTNYMRNLLAVVGIKSYPALINSEYNTPPADLAFPYDPFDHVILCVPDKKDTIWLECTSKNNETGFLGSFTENKNALLLTDEGGVMVKTPESNYANNKLFSQTEIWLNAEGGGSVETRLYVTGNIWDMFDEIRQMNKDRQQEIFMHYLDYKQPDNFLFNVIKDSASGYVLTVNLSYEKLYDFNAGNKFFFQQRVNRLCDVEMKTNEQRTIEYLFEFPYQKKDITVFHLPQGFTIDNLPSEKQLNTEFASYDKNIRFVESSKSLEINADLVLKKHIIPAKEYQKVAELFNSVNKDEAEKIVLTKQ